MEGRELGCIPSTCYEVVDPGWVGRVVELVNGAGPAHGKEASEGVWGRRAGCVVGGGQRDCCSGLSGTVWQSELPEYLCSGKLDGLLSESLVVC